MKVSGTLSNRSTASNLMLEKMGYCKEDCEEMSEYISEIALKFEFLFIVLLFSLINVVSQPDMMQIVSYLFNSSKIEYS
jgi:hypothetical protein